MQPPPQFSSPPLTPRAAAGMPALRGRRSLRDGSPSRLLCLAWHSWVLLTLFPEVLCSPAPSSQSKGAREPRSGWTGVWWLAQHLCLLPPPHGQCGPTHAAQPTPPLECGHHLPLASPPALSLSCGLLPSLCSAITSAGSLGSRNAKPCSASGGRWRSADPPWRTSPPSLASVSARLPMGAPSATLGAWAGKTQGQRKQWDWLLSARQRAPWEAMPDQGPTVGGLEGSGTLRTGREGSTARGKVAWCVPATTASGWHPPGWGGGGGRGRVTPEM